MVMVMVMIPIYIPFPTLAVIAVALVLRCAACRISIRTSIMRLVKEVKVDPSWIVPFFYLPFDRGKNWLNRPAGSYCALTFCSRGTFAP